MTTPCAAYLIARVSRSSSELPRQHPSFWEDMRFQPLTDEDEERLVYVPEAVFADRAAAEIECARREREGRELLNPFWLGGLEAATSLSEVAFRSRVSALGVPSPPLAPNTYEHAHLVVWWDTESPDWTADQRAAVWELLDKVRLFEVIETELE